MGREAGGSSGPARALSRATWQVAVGCPLQEGRGKHMVTSTCHAEPVRIQTPHHWTWPEPFLLQWVVETEGLPGLSRRLHRKSPPGLCRPLPCPALRVSVWRRCMVKTIQEGNPHPPTRAKGCTLPCEESWWDGWVKDDSGLPKLWPRGLQAEAHPGRGIQERRGVPGEGLPHALLV